MPTPRRRGAASAAGRPVRLVPRPPVRGVHHDRGHRHPGQDHHHVPRRGRTRGATLGRRRHHRHPHRRSSRCLVAHHAGGPGPPGTVRGDARGGRRGLRHGGVEPRDGAGAGRRLRVRRGGVPQPRPRPPRLPSRPRRVLPRQGRAVHARACPAGRHQHRRRARPAPARPHAATRHHVLARRVSPPTGGPRTSVRTGSAPTCRCWGRRARRSSCRCRLPGVFNVSNALAVVAALTAAGLDAAELAAGIAASTGVPGRMERVDAGQEFTALVDYAHKPDAVTAVLTALRPVTPGRLIMRDRRRRRPRPRQAAADGRGRREARRPGRRHGRQPAQREPGGHPRRPARGRLGRSRRRRRGGRSPRRDRPCRRARAPRRHGGRGGQGSRAGSGDRRRRPPVRRPDGAPRADPAGVPGGRQMAGRAPHDRHDGGRDRRRGRRAGARRRADAGHQPGQSRLAGRSARWPVRGAGRRARRRSRLRRDRPSPRAPSAVTRLTTGRRALRRRRRRHGGARRGSPRTCSVASIRSSSRSPAHRARPASRTCSPQVLEPSGTTIAPAGSFNNELGVPLTVLRADQETRFLVVEMGARGVGHIASLCRIAPPDVAVVLNVGQAHVGEFGVSRRHRPGEGRDRRGTLARGHRGAERR